jgi:hypothetical protein
MEEPAYVPAGPSYTCKRRREMELGQERLINEVLWLSRARTYFPWGPWPAGIATLKSRLRRIWNAGDYDRVSRYT